MTGALTVVLLAPAGSLHTRRWAAALTGAGHRVVVASWSPGPPLPAGELRIAPGGRSLRLPRARAWLRELVEDVRPDVVHVHSVGVPGLLSLALPSGPARVVTPWGSELRAAERSAARAAVIRMAVARADLVLPTSAEVAAEMIGRYRVPAWRTRVLSWGVAEELIAAQPSIRPETIRASWGIPRDATVVLSIRSVSATYRTRELVSAFAQAAAVRPDLFLVVLGGHRPSSASTRRTGDAYRADITAAAGVGADRTVIIDRTLSQLEVFGLMSAADVAVSIPPADQRSSSVLEAALAGCRLLLSDIAPYREMAGDGLAAGLLAEPVEHSLTDALGRTRPDPARARANADFIRTREREAEKTAALEQIYRELRSAQGGRFRRGAVRPCSR
jgi:glycosyltransferase involved in cell wall biosynthesis